MGSQNFGMCGEIGSVRDVHVKDDLTYGTTIHFINDVKDLLLPFSLSLIFIDMTGGEEQRETIYILLC